MTKAEYLSVAMKRAVDSEKVKTVKSVYGDVKNQAVRKLISQADETVFLDGDWRALSYSEILDAETDLHVSFSAQSLLPLFDCGDNDFVVYHLTEDNWSKFNIVDETVFSKGCAKLEDLF